MLFSPKVTCAFGQDGSCGSAVPADVGALRSLAGACICSEKSICRAAMMSVTSVSSGSLLASSFQGSACALSSSSFLGAQVCPVRLTGQCNARVQAKGTGKQASGCHHAFVLKDGSTAQNRDLLGELKRPY